MGKTWSLCILLIKIRFITVNKIDFFIRGPKYQARRDLYLKVSLFKILPITGKSIFT